MKPAYLYESIASQQQTNYSAIDQTEWNANLVAAVCMHAC